MIGDFILRQVEGGEILWCINQASYGHLQKRKVMGGGGRQPYTYVSRLWLLWAWNIIL